MSPTVLKTSRAQVLAEGRSSIRFLLCSSGYLNSIANVFRQNALRSAKRSERAAAGNCCP